MLSGIVNVIQEWGPYGDLRQLRAMVVANHQRRHPSVHLHNVDQSALRAAITRIDPVMANGENDHLLWGVEVLMYLSPADGAKLTGSADMALMASVMAARFAEAKPTDDLAFCGEVFDGGFRPLARPLAVAKHTADAGLTLVCPASSAPVARIANPRVIGVSTAFELGRVVCGERPYAGNKAELLPSSNQGVDMAFIKGQQNARRALEISVAGGHDMLMIGPPGEGKSLLAKAIPSIAPPLTLEEALDVTPIHQANGLVGPGEIVQHPPLRMIDPTVTKQALLGGGHQEPYPGEVSLAHHGVLFADELLQFTRTTLEALRTPLQDRQVSISRVNWKVIFPASFQLVAACNPCPCGYWGHPEVPCRCTPGERRRYAAKLSGPVVDRIEIRVWVPPLGEERFDTTRGEPSAAVAARIRAARQRQAERQDRLNADLGPDLMHLINLSPAAQEEVRRLVSVNNMSTRGMDNLCRVARTIADLAESDTIKPEHVGEAVQYIDVRLPKGA